MNDPATDAKRDMAIGDFRFLTQYRPDPNNPEKLIGEDWVDWLKLGDSTGARTSEKVLRLQANKERGRPPAPEWALIEPAYDAWKKGEEMPVEGTPLAAWPGCDPALADALKKREIYTVEQFANLPDHFIGTIPLPDIRARLAAAKKYVEGQASRDEMQAELAELRKQVEQLTEPKTKAKEKAA